MLYPPLDPNERFRARRTAVRRRKRRRRALAIGALLLLVLALAGGMTVATKGGKSPARASATKAPASASSARAARTGADASSPAARSAPRVAAPGALPLEVRGIHVTGPLASIPGKLDSYMELTSAGLNTIELDIKDEGGVVSYPADVPLVRVAGAGRSYYDAVAVARKAHRRGIHLIGRIVVFQDPLLARARPDLAIQRRDGSVWTTPAGLGWLNPYDRRGWGYAVELARSAARAGFDEIMFDYVRFPTDGDVENATYPLRTSQSRGRLIGDFLQYARRQLADSPVRISATLFGLAATRDMGIGQIPRRIAPHVHAISPMAYPALYGSGELGLERPSRQPGETVFRTLADFREQVRGETLLIPWIQDWSYAPQFVKAQVEATRLQGAKGFLLWNAAGRYTASALAPPATG